MRQAGAGGAENPGRMRLIDDQYGVVAVGDGGEVGHRCPIAVHRIKAFDRDPRRAGAAARAPAGDGVVKGLRVIVGGGGARSEEHTSELQSLMRISYAVFCLKKKK